MDNQTLPTEKVYNDNIFLVIDDKPNNGDKVLTENYGIWTFFDEGGGTAPLPYWANYRTCKKIISINGVKIEEICRSKTEYLNSPLKVCNFPE